MAIANHTRNAAIIGLLCLSIQGCADVRQARYKGIGGGGPTSNAAGDGAGVRMRQQSPALARKSTPVANAQTDRQ